MRLTMANCADGPTLVQINLQVGDTPLRAQAATAGIDDLRPALIRLDRQIVRASAQWCPRPWPDRPRRRLTTPAEALVTRRKPVVLRRATPLQAIAAMDAMDYDVHLFTDAETGRTLWSIGLDRRGCGWPASTTYFPRMVTLSRPSRAAGAADCEFASDTGSHGGRRGGPGARTWTAIPVFHRPGHRPRPAALLPLRRQPRVDHPDR